MKNVRAARAEEHAITLGLVLPAHRFRPHPANVAAEAARWLAALGLAAPAARVHPAKAPPHPSRTRPGANRRVVGLRLAAHQKKARRQRAVSLQPHAQ